ncbi:MAG: hypothetical protein ACTSQJ_00280 [Promethearchaeota archaeon]
MPSIISRFKKGWIIKFAGFFYKIENVERTKASWPTTSTSFTAATAKTYKIENLLPTKNHLVHIDKVGINSYLEIQLYYPEKTPRGAVRGVQRLSYKEAPHQNPYQFIFFIPETLEPYLDIYNPKSYNITGTHFIFFYGWIYRIGNGTTERPRDPKTGELLPYTEISNYIPLRG